MKAALAAGSLTGRLARSLVLGLTLLWLAGVVGSGFVLHRLIDQKSDDELQESAALLLSLVRYTDDILVTAAVLGEKRRLPDSPFEHDRFVYQIRDASGRTLLRSHNAPPDLEAVPLQEGVVNVGDWRVATVHDANQQRFVQLADPLAERRDVLVTSLMWLTIPLAGVLMFAVFIVLRASHTLAAHVQRTAHAVARQDPQALGLLPLDGIATEMKPAVEATNRLLARLSDALEAERSFTFNSAHELRTPIAAALAQAQLVASMAGGTPVQEEADNLVRALTRLARIAERLLALARAEGAQPLAEDWLDLARVLKVTAQEFSRDPRLAGRTIASGGPPVLVRGDIDAIGLAVRNLVENALVHATGSRRILLRCGETKDVAMLAVTDDGDGVAADEIETLARRFARSRNAGGTGAGLGLSIVDTLARRMGARLVLRSPPTGQERGFEARIVWPRGEPRDG
ncbi:MAG: HAMP domain-containing sensor histidine kinase [Burkholderiales bacterium]